MNRRIDPQLQSLHPCNNLAVVRAGNGLSWGSWVFILYSVIGTWKVNSTVQNDRVNLLQQIKSRLFVDRPFWSANRQMTTSFLVERTGFRRR